MDRVCTKTYPIAESPKPHPAWTVNLIYSLTKTEVKTSELKLSTEVNLKSPRQVPRQIKWSTAVEMLGTLSLREKNCKTLVTLFLNQIGRLLAVIVVEYVLCRLLFYLYFLSSLSSDLLVSKYVCQCRFFLHLSSAHFRLR